VDIGAPELLIILVIGLLIFGSNKLPKLARSLGQASREFKAATSQGFLEEKVTAAATTPPAATTVPAITTPAAPEAAPVAAPTSEAAAGPGTAVDTPSDAGASDSTPPGRTD
jgi:sec-independent protein translocase protein TatA